MVHWGWVDSVVVCGMHRWRLNGKVFGHGLYGVGVGYIVSSMDEVIYKPLRL